MAIWISSDWHCQPDKLKDQVVEWVRQGKEKNHRLIIAGDMFDILPLGKDKWQNAPSIAQLIEILDGYPLDYVTGNHDPYKVMTKLMETYSNSNIRMHKELILPDEHNKENLGDRKYLITHGHKWAFDWGHLGLRHVAPWFVEKMVDTAPGLWYRFCKMMGWLASKRDPNEPPGKELEHINKFTKYIWAGASNHALKNDMCVIIGHTHTSGKRELGIDKNTATKAYMVDDGDLPDGSYVEIIKDAEIKWLNQND